MLSVTLSLEVSTGLGPCSIVKFREVPLTALIKLPTAWRQVAGYLDAGPPRVVGGVRLVRGVGQPRQPADVRLNKWFCKNRKQKQDLSNAKCKNKLWLADFGNPVAGKSQLVTQTSVPQF